MDRSKFAVKTAEFYGGLVLMFLLLLVLNHFFPSVLPFGIYELFRFEFSWEVLKGIPWTLLFFGPVLTLVIRAFVKVDWAEKYDIQNNIVQDLWIAVKAGIFEEALHRWILFYYLIFAFLLRDIIINWLMTIPVVGSILALPWWAIACVVIVLNILAFFGYFIAVDKGTGCLWSTVGLILVIFVFFVDFAVILTLAKWWYVGVILPLVNFITLGKLSAQLFGYSWYVGAALVSSNWKFGEGHLYQGCLGFVYTWIIGMLMFWFTFNFGLPFAMLVHIVYDIIIRGIVYGSAIIQR